MTATQGGRETSEYRGQGEFATILRGYIRAAGLTYEELAEAAGLPLDTLLNWLKGRVQRPRNWRDVAQVARALRLSYDQADALLRAAAHPALALLKHAHPEEALLADWRILSAPPCDDANQEVRGILPQPSASLRARALSYTDEQTRPLLLDIPERRDSTPAPPTQRRWTARTIVGLALVAGLLTIFVGLVIWRDSVPPVGAEGWGVIGPLELAPMSVAPDGRRYVMVDQIVTATIHLRNNNSQTKTIPLFGVAAVGPDSCEKGWQAQNFGFPAVSSISEPPDGVYLYQKSASFTLPGIYFAEPGTGDGKGHGGGVAPYPRVWFTVTADPNNLPPRDCLTPLPRTAPMLG